MRAFARVGALCLATTLHVGAAGGQALADPTRPPGATGAAGEAAGADAPAPTVRLQSVLISRGRKLAVINGETVALGGKYGEAQLVRITETEVTLRKGSESEILRLYPDVEKKAVRRRGQAVGRPATRAPDARGGEVRK